MKSLQKWFTRGTEFIAAMTLAAIFITFLLGIFFRYAPFLEPIGWSVVLISLLWVWLIFFGCSFLVRETDHVAFDVLYIAAPTRIRKILALISAVLMIAAMVWSFPAVWEAIFSNRLMELKKFKPCACRSPATALPSNGCSLRSSCSWWSSHFDTFGASGQSFDTGLLTLK